MSFASIATNAVPIPPTTLHSEVRIDERLKKDMTAEKIDLEIQWSLKHGKIRAGTRSGTVVHRGRPSGVDVVTTTGETDDMVIVTAWAAQGAGTTSNRTKKPCRYGSKCRFLETCRFGHVSHDSPLSPLSPSSLKSMEMVVEEESVGTVDTGVEGCVA